MTEKKDSAGSGYTSEKIKVFGENFRDNFNLIRLLKKVNKREYYPSFDNSQKPIKISNSFILNFMFFEMGGGEKNAE